MDAHPRRCLLAVAGLAAAVAAVFASLAFAGGGGGGGGQGGDNETGCAHATEPVREITDPQLRKAMICLMNKERSRHARPRLKPSRALEEAAETHTDAMVETECLRHVCGNEPDLEKRLRRAGYLDDARKWQFAENTGCGLTAEAMVANWMASTYHRLNILGKKFRDLGVGVSDGQVQGRCKPGYGTFTAVFAYRVLDD
jgi:uncharacterized protein YkwD